jgi:hypothetical protein
MFKGTVSPDKICLEVTWFNRLGHVTLDFSNLLNPPFNFVLAAKFFCGPHYTLNNLPFLRKTVSVVTSRLRIFIHFLPIVAGVVLDVLGNQSAAISSHQHWRISPLSLGMQLV